MKINERGHRGREPEPNGSEPETVIGAVAHSQIEEA